MNREILFKAKTTKKDDRFAFNDVWAEGDLIESGSRYYIHPKANLVSVHNELGRIIVMHEVQTDTICQYTGLDDKERQ